MKKKIAICSLVAVAAMLVYVARLLAPATERTQALEMDEVNDSTLRIGFIGDSWAAWHRDLPCIMGDLLHSLTGREAEVKSAGLCGKTAKEIYEGVFDDDGISEVVRWRPDYCVVVAGINDTDKKSGKRRYAESMRCLISLMLRNGIKPVVLEIPDYDVVFCTYRRTRWVKLKRYAAMMLTGTKGVDCLDEYRRALRETIEENHWKDSLIYIERTAWNAAGWQDARGIYTEDRMHLNEAGYEVLDSCVAARIASDCGNGR